MEIPFEMYILQNCSFYILENSSLIRTNLKRIYPAPGVSQKRFQTARTGTQICVFSNKAEWCNHCIIDAD